MSSPARPAMSPAPKPDGAGAAASPGVDPLADFQSVEQIMELQAAGQDLIGLDLADEIQKLLDEAQHEVVSEVKPREAESGAMSKAALRGIAEAATPAAADVAAATQELTGLKEALDELLDVAWSEADAPDKGTTAPTTVSVAEEPISEPAAPALKPAASAAPSASSAGEGEAGLDLGEFQSMDELIAQAASTPPLASPMPVQAVPIATQGETQGATQDASHGVTRGAAMSAVTPQVVPAQAKPQAPALPKQASPEETEADEFLSVEDVAHASNQAEPAKPQVAGPMIAVESTTTLASVDEMLAEQAGHAVAHESASMPELLVNEADSPQGLDEMAFVDPAQVEAELRAILDQSVRVGEQPQPKAAASNPEAHAPGEAPAKPGSPRVAVLQATVMRFLRVQGRRAVAKGVEVGGSGAKALCALINRPIQDNAEARRLVGYAAMVTLANSVALVLYRFLLG